MISVTGLFGSPIQSSLSPQLHNAWFAKHEINARYVLFETPTKDSFFEEAHRRMSDSSFLGANITVPHKERALLLNKVTVDERAKAVGAGNVLYRDQNRAWHLGNTDVIGILDSLATLKSAAKFESELHTVLILGSGGSAKAVTFSALRDPNCKQVFVVTRTPRPEVVAWVRSLDTNRVTLVTPSGLSVRQDSKAIVVNTIPKEQPQHDTRAIDILRLFDEKNVCYFDLSYARTPALAFAEANDIASVDGLRMLTVQAAKSFELWTGILPVKDIQANFTHLG